MKNLPLIALLSLSLCPPGSAQGTPKRTTEIRDHIYSADGKPTTGTVIVSWPSFTTSNGEAIAAGTATSTIDSNGILDIKLPANERATPIGSYYTAIFHLEGGTVYRMFWVVPDSLSPVTLATVESEVLPTATQMLQKPSEQERACPFLEQKPNSTLQCVGMPHEIKSDLNKSIYGGQYIGGLFAPNNDFRMQSDNLKIAIRENAVPNYETDLVFRQNLIEHDQYTPSFGPLDGKYSSAINSLSVEFPADTDGDPNWTSPAGARVWVMSKYDYQRLQDAEDAVKKIKEDIEQEAGVLSGGGKIQMRLANSVEWRGPILLINFPDKSK